MKKVLSLVLVIAMVLSSMSFAFAGTFNDVPADDDYYDAIETLKALGVIDGYDDGSFKSEKTVTRAEMAKLMVELLGYGDLVAGSQSNFADTQGHWADPWIALAAGRGIVIGTGDGNFSPDRTVTYDEVLTMLVRGLGYTDGCNELKGMTWPTNFKVKAAELGITKNVTMSSTGADRGGVAQAMDNALEATLVSVTTDGDVTFLYDTYGDEKYDRILLTRLATPNYEYEVTLDTLDSDSKKYGGNIVDLAPYIYQELEVYLNDDDEVVYIKDNNSLVVEGTVADILDEDGNSYDDGDEDFDISSGNVKVVIEDANGKETKVTVKADDITAYYNGEEDVIEVEDFAELLYDKEVAKITAVIDDDDEDGVLDSDEFAKNLVVEKATEGILVDTEYTEGKTKLYGENDNIALPDDDGDVDLDAITVTGAVDSLEDIKVDDVVIAYKSISGDTVKLVVVRDTVEGFVNETNSSGSTVYIDKTKYSVSKVENAIVKGDIEAGDEGVFYLDDSGKVFAIDTEGAALTDYAVVIGVADGTTTTRFSDLSADDDAELKLLTQEGETVVYPIYVEFDGDEIDETATLDETKDLVELSADKKELNIQTVTEGDLIRYSLDEDGYIDEIELNDVETEPEKLDADELEDITTEDTIVFYREIGDTEDADYDEFIDDDYDVVSLSSVEDGTATVVYYTSGSNKDKIAVIYTTNAASENDGTYGVVTKTGWEYVNKERVQKITAFVDGEEVVYYTDDDKAGVDRITTSTAVEFKFNTSDELTGTSTVTTDTDVKVYTNAEITDIDTTEVTVGEDNYRYASGCVVYIYDKSADSWSIGDKSDIDEDAITSAAYAVDPDDSERIDIVVQVVK